MMYYLKYDKIGLKPVCFSGPGLYSHWEYKTELCFDCHLSSWSQCLLYVPTGLALKNSAVYPQSVFTYYVWISAHTVVIFLYGINWLVFITAR